MKMDKQAVASFISILDWYYRRWNYIPEACNYVSIILMSAQHLKRERAEIYYQTRFVSCAAAGRVGQNIFL